MKAPTAQLLSQDELTLDPEPAEEVLHQGLALKEEGNRALKEGRYHEAVGSYNRALEIFSGSSAERANCLSNLAAGLIRLNQLDEAEAVLRQAIDINPRHLNARLRIARLFATQNEHMLAASEWAVIEQIRPLTDAEAAEKNASNKKALDSGISTMKSWGNKILGKFGLSLDNFNVAKNADGSLNISLSQ